MTDDVKLRPCPFCGSQAGVLKSDDAFPRYIVICGNRFCPEQPTVEADSLENASVLWNTRPIEDKLKEALRFYANPDTHEPFEYDGGAYAEEILKELEE